jgi:hypothetical protein
MQTAAERPKIGNLAVKVAVWWGPQVRCGSILDKVAKQIGDGGRPLSLRLSEPEPWSRSPEREAEGVVAMGRLRGA